MKVVIVIAGLLVISTISSCKKCGHCLYQDGTTDDQYCNSGDNYNPNIYMNYKTSCENEPGAKWVDDK